MDWLLIVIIALACWLGYIFCLVWGLAGRGRQPAGGTICVLMGSQAGAAEWFLRNMYRVEGIITGRLAVEVAAEKSSDDTAGIVEIMSRKKGFRLVDPGGWPPAGGECPARVWFYDVRGMDVKLLKETLRSLQAL